MHLGRHAVAACLPLVPCTAQHLLCALLNAVHSVQAHGSVTVSSISVWLLCCRSWSRCRVARRHWSACCVRRTRVRLRQLRSRSEGFPARKAMCLHSGLAGLRAAWRGRAQQGALLEGMAQVVLPQTSKVQRHSCGTHRLGYCMHSTAAAGVAILRKVCIRSHNAHNGPATCTNGRGETHRAIPCHCAVC
jgi:hypothetical protein